MKKIILSRPIPHLPESGALFPPLLVTLFKVGAIWAIANGGYYLVLPELGINLSYNTSPLQIALYFTAWFILSVYFCWDLLKYWLPHKRNAWIYGAQALVSAMLLVGALYKFSQLPIPQGSILSPSTDLLLATPWYFFPKSMEILLQQVLIITLVLALMRAYRSIATVQWGYALYFGGAHIAFFLITNPPLPHAIVMTGSAFLSAIIAPKLILRVRGGALYSYALHLFGYILIASLLHTFPPPEYL